MVVAGTNNTNTGVDEYVFEPAVEFGCSGRLAVFPDRGGTGSAVFGERDVDECHVEVDEGVTGSVVFERCVRLFEPVNLWGFDPIVAVVVFFVRAVGMCIEEVDRDGRMVAPGR